MHPLDGYLLDGTPSKAETIAAVLRVRSADPRAQPFYRALERVGTRAADDALLALRLVLAGKVPTDDAIVAMRALRKRVHDGEPGAREAYRAEVGASPE